MSLLRSMVVSRLCSLLFFVAPTSATTPNQVGQFSPGTTFGPAPYGAMDDRRVPGPGVRPSQGELAHAVTQMQQMREVTSTDVYAAGQHMWFQESRKRHAPATPSISSLAHSATQSRQGDDQEDEEMLVDTAAAADAAAAEKPPAATPLLQPVPLDQDAAYACAAAQEGVDINDPRAIKQWMQQPIATRADVLRTIRGYHVGVIRTELYNVVGQIEQALTTLNDSVLRVQQNMQWMQADNRQSQKQASGLQVILSGWERTMDPETRLFMVDWMLRQVEGNRVFLRQRGRDVNRDDDEACYKFLEVLQQDPATPPAGQGAWSTITILQFRSWDLRRQFVSAFSGPTGTPLYKDSRTAVPGHHIRVSPSTPQFQRKLEIPVRVLLHLINNTNVFPEKQVVILWRTLTIMSPQMHRQFDAEATACARVHYFEADGKFQALLEVDEKLAAAMQATPPQGVEEPNCWSHSWNEIVFGVQHEMDLADKALFSSLLRDAKGSGKGVMMCRGSRHYSAPLIYSSDMLPYPIPIQVRQVPQIAFVWDEYCDKLSQPDQKVNDYKIATYKGSPQATATPPEAASMPPPAAVPDRPFAKSSAAPKSHAAS